MKALILIAALSANSPDSGKVAKPPDEKKCVARDSALTFAESAAKEMQGKVVSLSKESTRNLIEFLNRKVGGEDLESSDFSGTLTVEIPSLGIAMFAWVRSDGTVCSWANVGLKVWEAMKAESDGSQPYPAHRLPYPGGVAI